MPEPESVESLVERVERSFKFFQNEPTWLLPSVLEPAKAALATLSERLEAAKQKLKDMDRSRMVVYRELTARAEAAEAERDRLREMMEELRHTTAYDEYGFVKECVDYGLGLQDEFRYERRAAIADQEGEA